MTQSSESSGPDYKAFPDQNGHFGRFGGRFVSETLMAALDELDHRFWQSKQSLEVRDMATRFVDQRRNFRLAHLLLLGEMLVGARLFDRIEVFALDIFDQRNRHDLTLIQIANNRRNFMQFRPLRSTPAAFARNQLVTTLASQGTDDNRLDDAPLGNGPRQLVERFVVEDLARLIGQRLDMRDRNFRQPDTFGRCGPVTLGRTIRQHRAAFVRNNALFALRLT